MGRRAAWTQWWISAAGAGALAVLGTLAVATTRDLNLPIVLADLALFLGTLTCMVVNRPGWSGRPAVLSVPDQRRRAAIREVRRGVPVSPELHADAVEAVRRGWYVVSMLAAGWAGLAVVLAAGPGLGRGLPIAGEVLLLATLVALGACGQGLRRADRADRADAAWRPRPIPYG